MEELVEKLRLAIEEAAGVREQPQGLEAHCLHLAHRVEEAEKSICKIRFHLQKIYEMMGEIMNKEPKQQDFVFKIKVVD